MGISTVDKKPAHKVKGSRSVIGSFFLLNLFFSNTVMASMPEWSTLGKPWISAEEWYLAEHKCSYVYRQCAWTCTMVFSSAGNLLSRNILFFQKHFNWMYASYSAISKPNFNFISQGLTLLWRSISEPGHWYQESLELLFVHLYIWSIYCHISCHSSVTLVHNISKRTHCIL